MPKEIIYGTVLDGFTIKVGWDRDSNIQVASLADEGEKRVRDILAAEERDPTGRVFDGWYVTLDRDGVNKLIRTLRRARDQAFGRDE